ncbi:MAG TPA: HAD-IC family P-type ATPase, partial [Bryobacterales bacterium]|nr:HAD-IC family P-type ATPase [Bryobacterales bacterium]
MVRILILAGLISAALRDYHDAIAILAIVALNALLGFTQEYRAEKAMAALKRLAAPAARVRRNGRVREIPARELAPGDIVLLEAGNLVPADCRLIEGFNLRIQEAVLTGESEPVEKDPRAPEKAGAPLGDRRSVVYMGTIVTYGRGQAVVTQTGMRTELGRIAGMMRAAEPQPSPLQRRLDELGRGLALIALAFVAV